MIISLVLVYVWEIYFVNRGVTYPTVLTININLILT